jgi:hypothetical protein
MEIVMKLSQAKNIVYYSLTSQTVKYEVDTLPIVCYLEGGAGLGKTSLLQQICEEHMWFLYILSLAQFDAAEIAGIIALVDGKSERLMPYWLRKLWEMSKQCEKVVLFLDELPQSVTSNMNIAAQIVNEHRIGEFKLPENCAVVCAGNRTSDRAGTNTIPTHLRDRLLFVPVEADLEDVIPYWLAQNVHEDVIGFNRAMPQHLHNFDPKASVSSSPRSWHRVSTILSWGLDPICENEAISGTVGRSICADFMGYRKLKANMPDLDKVISNPDSAEIPSDAMVLYALAAGLSHKMNKANAGNIIKYLKRLDAQEFAAFTVKDAVNRDQTLKQSEAVRQWIITDGKQLIL